MPYPWPDPSEGGDGVDSDGSDYWDGSGDEDGSNDDGEDCSCAWTSSSEKDATDDDEPAPPTPTVPECDVRATVTSTVYPPWFTSDGYYSASDDDTAEESMLESELGGPRRRPRHGWMHDWWRGLSHLFWGDGGEGGEGGSQGDSDSELGYEDWLLSWMNIDRTPKRGRLTRFSRG